MTPNPLTGDTLTDTGPDQYVARFDRIGRNHDVPDLTVDGTADDIAYAIHKYARGFLGSRDYIVTLDLTALTGSIGLGRFGSFTLAPKAREDGAA